jgi:hypothetical protein
LINFAFIDRFNQLSWKSRYFRNSRIKLFSNSEEFAKSYSTYSISSTLTKNTVESSSYAKNASWNITSANAIRRSLKSIKCAKRAKIESTSYDRRSAKCVERKNKKQNTLDKFECDYISWANRKLFSTCFDSLLIRRQHRSRSRSRTRKSLCRSEKWLKKKKRSKRLKSNIFFELSLISRWIEFKNNIINSRDKNSWTNNAIMNSKNMKKLFASQFNEST